MVVGDSAADPHDCQAAGAAQHHKSIIPWITSWGKGQNLEFIVWFLVNVQYFYMIKSKNCKWNHWVLYCPCNKSVGFLFLNLLWDLPWCTSHSDLIVIQEKNCFVLSCLYGGGFPGASGIKNPPEIQETWIRGTNPWVGKIPWRRKWQPTPVFLPGESHGQRSLVDYNPKGHKESDRTKVI